MPVCWFVGLTTLDVVHRAAAPPARNQKITATRQDVAAGGPAANATVTAAALGVDAVLISALGNSPQADVARRDLEDCRVQVADVERSQPLSAHLCVANRGNDDTNVGTQPTREPFELAISAVLVDDDTGERSVVSPDGSLAVVPGPSSTVLDELPTPDVIMFDGHHPEVARAVLAWIEARETRPQVVLDAGRWRPIFAELIPAADVVAASADFRVPVSTVPRPAFWVTTHGAEPAEWRASDDREGSVVPPKVEARDTLGAGDAFHGALVAAIANGASPNEAVERAVAVASLRVQHVGPRGWMQYLPTV